MTQDGLKYVSDIKKGDYVLTGNKTFTMVNKTEKSLSSLLLIKGHGHPKLIITDIQEIYATNYKRTLNPETEKTERKFDKPNWVFAKDLKGMFWASPICFLETKSPIELNENIAWLMGAYLGNGYINYNKIYFNTNHFREDELKERLELLGLRLNKVKKGSIYEYNVNHAVLADWLRRTFNIEYGIKNIPYWVYGIDEEYRENFFKGFVWSNGTFKNESYRFSIKNNKCLAIGIKLIAQTLGYSTALYLFTSKKKNRITERWQIIAEINARSSVVIGDNRYGLIREISKNERKHITYKLELETGNSLMVDGIILKI